jgi:hypothetical protein
MDNVEIQSKPDNMIARRAPIEVIMSSQSL